MTWDAFGALAEAIAAVGVIASLLYLARQIRHQSDISEVQAKFSLMGLLNEYTSMLIERPDLDELYVRGRRDIEQLTGEGEQHRFANMCLRAFWFFSASHFQRVRGQISDDEWIETETVIHFWLRGPGVRAWWERWGRSGFGERFVTFVDGEIPKVEAEVERRRRRREEGEGSPPA